MEKTKWWVDFCFHCPSNYYHKFEDKVLLYDLLERLEPKPRTISEVRSADGDGHYRVYLSYRFESEYNDSNRGKVESFIIKNYILKLNEQVKKYGCWVYYYSFEVIK